MASAGHRYSFLPGATARLHPPGSYSGYPLQGQGQVEQGYARQHPDGPHQRINDVSKVAITNHLAPPTNLIESIKVGGALAFRIPAPAPLVSLWLESLTGPHLDYLRTSLLAAP